MSRYIDEEEVVKALTNNQTYSATVIRSILDRIPTADVEPVRHGHWERVNPANRPTATGTFKCSECGHCYIMRVFEKYNSCPHCWAKMDGKKDT